MAWKGSIPQASDLLVNSQADILGNFGALAIGWLDAEQTWQYASSTTITVPTDATAKYAPGMKIKITQSTGGTKYFYITTVTSTLLTVVSPLGSVVNNEAISSPCYSSAFQPLGYPNQELTSKSGYFDYDISTASGTTVVTGIGFKPRTILAFYGVLNSTDKYGNAYVDSALGQITAFQQTGGFNMGAIFVNLYHFGGAGNYLQGSVTAVSSDGFTITWTKTGIPTGTLKMTYLCLR